MVFADALREARVLAPQVAADVLHFSSGLAFLRGQAGIPARAATAAIRIGMIDGGVAPGVRGEIVQRIFQHGDGVGEHIRALHANRFPLGIDSP